VSIVRFETVTVNQLTRGIDAYGEATVTATPLFTSQGRVHDVKNALELNEQYRLYADYLSIWLNFTPATLQVAEDQENYSVTWRGQDWRITDSIESDDRMTVRLMCYRAKPGVQP
jgi:hypothetical protein